MGMLSDAAVVATIAVKDFGRAKQFYGEKLGLSAVKEFPNDGGVTYQCGKGTQLLVYPSQFGGTNQATCASFEVADIKAAMEELRGQGITFEDYDLPGLKTENGVMEMDGEYAAWFKDPDGNILAVGQFK